MKNRIFQGILILLTLVVLAGQANALPIYSFYRITGNANENVAGQLFVDVTAYDTNQVSFKFTNTGSIASSITDIYFDDGTLLGIAQIINSAGVAFSAPATPSDLPGGNLATPPFVTTQAFSADSDPPVARNGVNNDPEGDGEYVQIIFDLIGGKIYSDTLAALADGSLRIGLHVQGIGGIEDQSDSFINNSVPIPEPATMLLVGSGLIGFAAFKKRFRKS